MCNILILRYCVAVAKPVILQQDFIYHTYEIQINSHGKCLRPRDDGLPVLTGCEDSEKEEQLTTVEASGRFATKLLMDIGNGKLLHQEIPSTVVTISPETATTVKLQFSAFSVDVQQDKAPLHGADVQSFTVPGVQLKKEADGSFTLSGSPQFTTLMRLGMGNAPRQSAQFKEYKATESSLQGTLKNGVLHLNLTFKPGSMPMPLSLTYDGSRQ